MIRWTKIISFSLSTALLIAFFVGLGLHHIEQSIHCGQLLYCVDNYWANFWLTSYSDGYTRRALWGQIMAWTIPHNFDAKTLNKIAAIIPLLILSLFSSILMRSRSDIKFFAFFVLTWFACPGTSVLFETLGDPLQICMLLFLLTAVSQSQLPRKIALPLAVLSGIASALIHEASIFLLIPAYILLWRKSCPTKHTLLLCVFIEFILCGIFVLFTSEQPVTTSTRYILTANNTAYHLPTIALPKFSVLLATELQTYLGNIDGILYAAKNFLTTILYPLSATYALSLCTNRFLYLRYFLSLYTLSLPLYLIAHDWGRFAVYSFIASVTLTTLTPDSAVKMNTKPIPRRLGMIMLILPVIYQAHSNYRVDGLKTTDIIIIAATMMSVVTVLYIRQKNNIARKLT